LLIVTVVSSLNERLPDGSAVQLARPVPVVSDVVPPTTLPTSSDHSGLVLVPR
jgi:hypothetical protein